MPEVTLRASFEQADDYVNGVPGRDVDIPAGRPFGVSTFIQGTVLRHSTPVVMGVLNVTPDSFSDGGRYADRVLPVLRDLTVPGLG